VLGFSGSGRVSHPGIERDAWPVHTTGRRPWIATPPGLRVHFHIGIPSRAGPIFSNHDIHRADGCGYRVPHTPPRARASADRSLANPSAALPTPAGYSPCVPPSCSKGRSCHPRNATASTAWAGSRGCRPSPSASSSPSSKTKPAAATHLKTAPPPANPNSAWSPYTTTPTAAAERSLPPSP
jgi:hypothetical protein